MHAATILLIEDDRLFVRELIYFINNEFKDIHILNALTLGGFIDMLPQLTTSPPDFIVVDLFMPKEKEMVNKYGYNNDGGLICLDLLTNNQLTATIPIIICSAKAIEFSCIDKSKYPQIANYYRKPISIEDMESILSTIRSVLVKKGLHQLSKQNVKNNVLDAIDLKPGIFGIRVDIKKLFKKRKDS
jgi:CheY-like chemotaxis protein